MFIRVFLITVLLFCSLLSKGQVVKGEIKDEKSITVLGAHIQNLRTKMHTHSDEQGRFEIEQTKGGDTLKISYIGYETAKILIQDTKSLLEISIRVKPISVSDVVITPSVRALNAISALDLRTAPVNSSQEVLTRVPGLFIGQHAGGGKAEQIFLRGFDVDHGTDVAISVDGIPVNMVSHAHGQGYADLHFLIPETIQKIDFGKGPYYSEQGNFNTAGYIKFNTKESLKYSSLKMEIGQFNTHRLLAMINLMGEGEGNTKGYLAGEFLSSDGPFNSPQNFKRTNIFGKFSQKLSDFDHITLTASHFSSEWDASGQIPIRAVQQGLIDRFGAIDDTEGGQTSRTNVQLSHRKFLNNNAFIKNTIFYSHYDFRLFSNFTFFLEDPIHGDQIKQEERRNLIGFSSDYNSTFSLGQVDGNLRAGISLRSDYSSGNELSYTFNRQETLRKIQFGDIDESNIGGYTSFTFNLNKWTINPGFRIDYFDFQYKDGLSTLYHSQSSTTSIISPKLNVLYQMQTNLQFYLKSGSGFHSNDTRVIIAISTEQKLPAAYGLDIGSIWKPIQNVLINTAYWNLFSEQEFVYVGDAGIVAPSGSSSRHGLDLSLRYQIRPWLIYDLDVNYTFARSDDAEEGKSYIPLAPRFTLVSGLQFNHNSGMYAGLNVQHMGDRPATEDNHIIAEGYSVFNFNAGYQWGAFNLGLQVNNVFNTEWNETQFATRSRLANESQAVEEIHFTPGAPRFVKGLVEYIF